MYLARWPELDRRWTLSTNQPFEPFWLPDGSLMVHHPSGRAYTIAIRPGADPPHGPVQPLFDDSRMGETPGWSNSIGSHSEIVYPVMPDQPYVDYLRVVPGWIMKMERAVNEANR